MVHSSAPNNGDWVKCGYSRHEPSLPYIYRHRTRPKNLMKSGKLVKIFADFFWAAEQSAICTVWLCYIAIMRYYAVLCGTFMLDYAVLYGILRYFAVLCGTLRYIVPHNFRRGDLHIFSHVMVLCDLGPNLYRIMRYIWEIFFRPVARGIRFKVSR